MARLIHDVREMQRAAERERLAGKRLAVVPTMGSLHDGHASLIRAARKHAEIVMTTVFVNPTQFGPAEDFEQYPRDLSRDTAVATAAGTDYVFAPAMRALYPDGYATYLEVERLSTVLEGKSRSGHFRGVTTVVAKLFHITKPHVAVFGQKDAQQVVVIRQMIRDLDFDIELLVCPTVRGPDGLAMSSRNTYLTPAQRREAPVLFRSLQLAERLLHGGERSSASIKQAMIDLISKTSFGVIDYISIADEGTLEELAVCEPHRPLLISLAVRFGSTRLIDNTIVSL